MNINQRQKISFICIKKKIVLQITKSLVLCRLQIVVRINVNQIQLQGLKNPRIKKSQE